VLPRKGATNLHLRIAVAHSGVAGAAGKRGCGPSPSEGVSMELIVGAVCLLGCVWVGIAIAREMSGVM
jgi:hypothetical protein